MILTAHIPQQDIAFYSELRRLHFPVARNHLDAHVTIFHNISDRHVGDVCEVLAALVQVTAPSSISTAGVRHLGNGVAFNVEGPALHSLRGQLRSRFEPWLVPQDLHGWRPHITIQNSVSKAKADELYSSAAESFQPKALSFTGLDLWHYRGGPWQLEKSFQFSQN